MRPCQDLGELFGANVNRGPTSWVNVHVERTYTVRRIQSAPVNLRRSSGRLIATPELRRYLTLDSGSSGPCVSGIFATTEVLWSLKLGGIVPNGLLPNVPCIDFNLGLVCTSMLRSLDFKGPAPTADL